MARHRGFFPKEIPMPRRPRLDIPGIPQHVIQRGNDRQPCFYSDIDRIRYLDTLHELCEKTGCRVHAYVLMTNHVHLLMTPSEIGAVSRLLQGLGRRYVRYFNDRYRRTGTLWEGRYKAGLVEDDIYLLRCHRYIELNPVRAAMVSHPADHPWSSFACNAIGKPDVLVQPHPTYLALGSDDRLRRMHYRQLFDEAPDADELQQIRRFVQGQYALGSARFQDGVEASLQRRARPGPIGRPRRRESAL
jgi:putative transposase